MIWRPKSHTAHYDWRCSDFPSTSPSRPCRHIFGISFPRNYLFLFSFRRPSPHFIHIGFPSLPPVYCTSLLLSTSCLLSLLPTVPPASVLPPLTVPPTHWSLTIPLLQLNLLCTYSLLVHLLNIKVSISVLNAGYKSYDDDDDEGQKPWEQNLFLGTTGRCHMLKTRVG